MCNKIDARTRRARKEHRCWACHRLIQPREKYRIEKYTDRDMFFAFYEYGDRAFNHVFQGAIAEYRKYYFCPNSPGTVEEVTILSMEPPRRGQPPRINIQDESGEKHSVHPIMLEFKRFRQ